MPTELPCLIIAVTGRALAASARRGGYRPAVLDLFADRDTSQLASPARSVVADGALRFDADRLAAAVRELGPIARAGGMVYGSGFEGRTALLRRLVRGHRLLGNAPDVVDRIRDPRQFFPLLDQLAVPYPEVSYQRPADPRGWLMKRPGGAGGAHIRRAPFRSVSNAYYQREIEGEPHSVLFLADGRRAEVIGFNRQWLATGDSRRPFLFGGAVGGITLGGIEGEIVDRLNAIVADTRLVGLNGLDFILQDDRWYALELNPRPTATMELYDVDFPSGLFRAHVEAVEGRLTAKPAISTSRALAIVTAPLAWPPGSQFQFPPWCRDLPWPEVEIPAGAPICTVHAEASEATGAEALVREREGTLRALVLGQVSGASR